MTLHELLVHLRGMGAHVSLDGDRVHIRAPKGAIDGATMTRLRESKAELKELLEELRPAVSRYPPLVPRPRTAAPPPASFAQQRLWFVDRLRGSTEYHIVDAQRLLGPLDYDALERAIQTIVARHETLRTHFAEVDGQLLQIIAPELSIPVPIDELAGDQETRDAQITEAMARERRLPFVLSEGPLLRVRLLRAGPEDHILVHALHHIVSDAWSESVFHRELFALYAAYRDGRPNPLPPLTVQYADFAVWQRGWLDTATLNAGLSYWTTQLAGLPEELALPRDRPRPASPSGEGAVCWQQVPATQLAALKAIGHAQGATLYMTLLAAFGVLLARCTGQDDIAIGSPIGNRPDPQLDPLIGFFVNALVMRVHVDATESFAALLQRVRQTTLDAYEHQDIPFERIVEALAPKRSASLAPLFQASLSLQNVPASMAPDTKASGFSVQRVASKGIGVHGDVELHVTERDGSLSVMWLYDPELFDRWRIEQMARLYARLVQQIAIDPTRRIETLDWLDPAERAQLIDRWNDTGRTLPDLLLPALFERQEARAPDAIAVVFDDRCLSYAELNRRANQLARYLRGRGVGLESRVAVYADVSIELVIALLGIVKAGAAFVPLDPTYPRERLMRMIGPSGASLLVTWAAIDADLSDAGPQVARLDVEWPAIAGERDSNLGAWIPADAAAYVMYTSGSTGAPHGVVATHGALANLALAQIDRFRISARSRLLQFASFCFDASVSELATAWAAGSTLVLANRQARLGDALAEQLVRHGVTHVTLPPIVLATLPADCPAPSEVLIVAGEACPQDLVDAWSRRRVMINGYGPTETTVCATMSGALAPSTPPPLGTPIWNGRTYVLDSRLQPVPIGVVGELFVGGLGLARGYLHAPGLTAQRFVASPFGPPGARLYRTGDLVQWRALDAIEFVGRADHQVKIRGQRIELTEVEMALARHAQVSEAVVVVRETQSGDRRLIGYVAGDPARFDLDAVLGRLRLTLPEHMVPAALVAVETWPLSPSGKLDRAALPDPAARSSAALESPPITPPEELLCQLFSEVLGVPRVGVTDNFFDLGGHSLLAARLAMRVKATLGLEVMIGDLFDAPTVQTLIQRLSFDRMVTVALDRIFALRPNGTLPPLFCVPPAGGLAWSYAGLLPSIDPERPILALQTNAVTADVPLPESVEAVRDDYLALIRKAQPRGPYHLVGWSFGGLVAHAIACQLQAEGEQVPVLVMIDGYPAEPDAIVPVSDPQRNERRAAARAMAKRIFGLTDLQNRRMWRLVFHTDTLGEMFRPGRFVGDAFVFTSAGLLPRVSRWVPHVSGVIHSHEGSCSHDDMMRDESIRFIGQRINEALRQASAVTADA